MSQISPLIALKTSFILILRPLYGKSFIVLHSTNVPFIVTCSRNLIKVFDFFFSKDFNLEKYLKLFNKSKIE